MLRSAMRAHLPWIAIDAWLAEQGWTGGLAVDSPQPDVRLAQIWTGRDPIPYPDRWAAVHEIEGVRVAVPRPDALPIGVEGLVSVIDRLLGPGGCPWDQAQTHETLKKYLLEETYEVLDAIDAGDLDKLREELGDLLLQPILHAQMEQLEGRWGTTEVAEEVMSKLVRRHPHVFGDVVAADADEVLRNWDRIKREEKGEPQSILEGVPRAMAALLRAHEVSKRAARAGFEWPDIESVFDKLHEEELELREAISSGDPERIAAEVGDLLFTAVNVARWAKVEPEDALRRMLDRFTARFQEMERQADHPLDELSPARWDELWERAKRSTSTRPSPEEAPAP